MRRLALALALAAALPASAGVRPSHGGTLRLALPGLPTTFDPALAVEPQDLLAARATSAPLLELDAAGQLAPGLLEEVPVAEAGGRSYRLRLRADLRTFDDRPVGAAELAAALTRLASPSTASPHAWAVLPILGAEVMLAGRAPALAGLSVVSERELVVTLERPLPGFPRALAALPLALPGLGPFQPPRSPASGDALALAPNPRCPRGRPFAASLVLVAARDARTAARLLERGEVDLVLRAEAAGGRAGPTFPALGAVVAALEPGRLGAGLAPLRAALAALDRGDLARRRARGAGEPMLTIVPGALLPVGDLGEPANAPGGALPAKVTLLVPEGAPDARAAADRIQVRLFDLGVRAAVEPAPRERFLARLAARDYDVALVQVPVLSTEPALAAAEVAFAVRGADGARRALAALGQAVASDLPSAALVLGRDLALVPLFAVAPRASLGPAAHGLAPRADGGFDPGELWRLRGGAP